MFSPRSGGQSPNDFRGRDFFCCSHSLKPVDINLYNRVETLAAVSSCELRSKMLDFNAALSTVVEVDKKSQAAGTQPAGVKPNGPLSAELLGKMQRYWCAANYLCVGQIYLLDNPLLREPLVKENIKPRLLGHWGTSAGQNFIYVHLNRLIRETDANIIYISGPGHGGPTLNACAYLEGTY